MDGPPLLEEIELFSLNNGVWIEDLEFFIKHRHLIFTSRSSWGCSSRRRTYFPTAEPQLFPQRSAHRILFGALLIENSSHNKALLNGGIFSRKHWRLWKYPKFQKAKAFLLEVLKLFYYGAFLERKPWSYSHNISYFHWARAETLSRTSDRKNLNKTHKEVMVFFILSSFLLRLLDILSNRNFAREDKAVFSNETRRISH